LYYKARKVLTRNPGKKAIFERKRKLHTEYLVLDGKSNILLLKRGLYSAFKNYFKMTRDLQKANKYDTLLKKAINDYEETKMKKHRIDKILYKIDKRPQKEPKKNIFKVAPRI
jgi:hypothetical protein